MGLYLILLGKIYFPLTLPFFQPLTYLFEKRNSAFILCYFNLYGNYGLKYIHFKIYTAAFSGKSGLQFQQDSYRESLEASHVFHDFAHQTGQQFGKPHRQHDP